MPNADAIRAALRCDRPGCECHRPKGRVHCPHHDPQRTDETPSLSLAETSDGKVLVHCFRPGCGQGDIVASLRAAGLWPEAHGRNAQRPQRRQAADRAMRLELRDASGTLVAIHVRRDFPDGTKSFFWERPDGTPGLGGLPVADLPLYGIHELGGRKTVVLVEGEKARDALARVAPSDVAVLGTVTGAAATPSLESLRPLVGRAVVLWPDNDEAGRGHMHRNAANLQTLGVAPRWVEWADAPPGGDAADFVRMHGAGEALDRLLADARLWTPEAGADDRGDGIFLADVQPERVHWLWPGRIPLGKVTVLDGDPGLGKSLVTLDIAARVSTGRPMPDGARSDLDGPRGVVLLSAEDDLADTVRPRLDVMGADTTRILALITIRGGGVEAMPTIADLTAIEAAVRRVDAALVVIDPLMAYVPDHRDSHKDQDIRRGLAPLARLAADLGVAVVVVRHLNKQGAQNPLYRGGGSIGIIAAARSGLLVAPDPDDRQGRRRILVPTKSNLTVPAPALAYQVIAPDGVAVVEWLGSTDHTAAALLAAQVPEAERSALEEAASFLRDLLADGPLPSEKVKAAARQAGIAARTLDRARSRIKATSRRKGFGPGAVWVWSLRPSPPPFSPTLQGAGLGENGAVGENGVLSGFPPSPEPSFLHSRQATGVGENAPTGPCHACRGTRFWVSIHGTVVCATCHPPASPDLVARWIGPEPLPDEKESATVWTA